MPKFKKKPEGEGRGEWTEDAMKLAVSAVIENQMSERAASKRYNVPRSTLQRKIKAI
jgi:transposase